MLTLDTLLPDEEDDVKKLLAKPKHVERQVKECPVLKDRKLSKDARNFLNRLLTYDAQKRITAEEALQHPFIQKHAGAQLGLDKTHDKTPMPRHICDSMVAKMEAYAKASPLERIALLAVAHTISQRPDKELIEVRFMFRTLNKSGNGKLCPSEIEEGLQSQGFTLPAHFREVLTACSSSGTTLNFNEFIACNLPDAFRNEQLFATVFRLMDRDGNDRIGPNDLKIMYAAGGAEAPEICENFVFESTGKTAINSAEFVSFMMGKLV